MTQDTPTPCSPPEPAASLNFPRVQRGHHDLGCGPLLADARRPGCRGVVLALMLLSAWIGVDLGAVAGGTLRRQVVDDLVDQVMQAVGPVADVHRQALAGPDRALEDLDGTRVVGHGSFRPGRWLLARQTATGPHPRAQPKTHSRLPLLAPASAPRRRLSGVARSLQTLMRREGRLLVDRASVQRFWRFFANVRGLRAHRHDDRDGLESSVGRRTAGDISSSSRARHHGAEHGRTIKQVARVGPTRCSRRRSRCRSSLASPRSGLVARRRQPGPRSTRTALLRSTGAARRVAAPG